MKNINIHLRTFSEKDDITFFTHIIWNSKIHRTFPAQFLKPEIPMHFAQIPEHEFWLLLLIFSKTYILKPYTPIPLKRKLWLLLRAFLSYLKFSFLRPFLKTPIFDNFFAHLLHFYPFRCFENPINAIGIVISINAIGNDCISRASRWIKTFNLCETFMLAYSFHTFSHKLDYSKFDIYFHTKRETRFVFSLTNITQETIVWSLLRAFLKIWILTPFSEITINMNFEYFQVYSAQT